MYFNDSFIHIENLGRKEKYVILEILRIFLYYMINIILFNDDYKKQFTLWHNGFFMN